MQYAAYVRLSRSAPKWYAPDVGHIDFLFIDCPPGGRARSLREVPHRLVSHLQTVVLRDEDELIGVEEISNLLQALGSRPRVGLLGHHVAQAPTITWHGAPEPVPDKVTSEARAIELNALLHLGKAYWRPDRFHFLLPSGKHANAFLKVEQAFRTARDTTVIAYWLLEHAGRRVGLILDTRTLLSLGHAFETELVRRDHELVSIASLDPYPRTALDVYDAIRSLEDADNLVAVVSASATGNLLHRLHVAFSTMAAGYDSVNIVNMVSLSSQLPANIKSQHGVPIDTFLDLPRDNEPEFQVWNSPCPQCANHKTAQLIPIDPRTFDATFPTLFPRVTPSISEPRRNYALWEACDETDGLWFHQQPNEEVLGWRPTHQPMGIKTIWKNLIRCESFATAAARNFATNIQRTRQRPLADDWGNIDLILAPKEDVILEGFEAFLSACDDALGIQPGADVKPFDRRDSAWNEQLRQRIRKARGILVLTLGCVTGTTLQRALVGVQEARRDRNYLLRGAVVHARPSRRESWRGLVNAYAGNLTVAFRTFLPTYSPLEEEQKLIADVDDSRLSRGARKFKHDRLAYCEGAHHGRVDSTLGVLWNTSSDDKITPHSIFGDQLRTPSIFVAVASAIHERRQTATPPIRQMFDLPKIAASYYDVLIFCCMLRWLRPWETAWGIDDAATGAVIKGMYDRCEEARRPTLVAELQLAAALGKLNQPAKEASDSLADTLLRALPEDDCRRAPLELAKVASTGSP